jgi:galactokinase
MEIFVSGRVCLFGEHNDWAAEGQKDILPGKQQENSYSALVMGTQQGIYARASKHPTKLVVNCPFLTTIRSHSNETISPSNVEIDMNELSLEKETKRSGSFFRYIAGVALHIRRQTGCDGGTSILEETQHIAGITLDIYKSDLPMKKGLSSSGAICVLTAQAFSKCYDMNLSHQQIMELAYQGEILTGSKCGRMDQVCVYGSNQLCYMTFKQNAIPITQPINAQLDLFFVIVDLGSEKDTVEILNQLQKNYYEAVAEDSPIRTFFRQNRRTVHEAKNILEMQYTSSANLNNQVEKLGNLMSDIQNMFDRCLTPLCLGHLRAPILHKVASYTPIQHLIFGGKWIGSGGDGSLLLLTKDEASQQKVIRILYEELKLYSWPLSILI